MPVEITDIEEIRSSLQDGDCAFIKRIFEDHLSFCVRMLTRNSACSRADAEDIYIDAIINLRDKIVSGQVDRILSIRGYLLVTCNNMLLVRLKREERIGKATLEFHRAFVINAEDEKESDYRETALADTKIALSRIGARCQDLLRSFYFDKLSIEAISKKYNLANANVAKVSKSRCFQKLVEQVKIIQAEKSKENAIK